MIKKILVPLDGSEFAKSALPYAESLALKYDAELLLVQSLQPMLVVSQFVERAMAFYGPRLLHNKNIASMYLRSVQDKLRAPARTVVLEGRPIADAIIEIASQEAVSLIVMTKHSRSGLDRWLADHVADEVLQHAPCPVFLINVPKMKDGSYKDLSTVPSQLIS
ncbi:MAG: universal stress protein [Chloroflexi bacterium]|nr:universal stress protein [Chloroflexota bacterium]